MKHYIKKAFVAMVAFALTGAAWGHTQKIGTQTWTYDLVVDGGKIVAKVQGVTPATSDHLTIPSTLGSYDVKIIANNAFYDQNWSGVTIPNTVTNIGTYAFYGCGYLTGSLTIPASVVSIGHHAFAGCNGLTSLTFKNGSLKTIGWEAFRACSSLTTVSIPDSVQNIGDDAFKSCWELKKVDVPGAAFDDGSLTPDKAFSGTAENFSLVFRHTVGGVTFYYTVSNYAASDSYATIQNGGEKAIKPMDTVNVTIPGKIRGHKVTLIGEDAFQFCKMTSVTLPDGLVGIGNYAFSYCTSLASITFPGTVLMIGKGSFQNCDALTSVNLNNVGAMIGDYAFGDCDNLTSVTFPSAVLSLGTRVFGDCDKLQTANIPLDSYDTVNSKETFSNCPSSLVKKYSGTRKYNDTSYSVVYIPGDGFRIGDGVNPAIDTTTSGSITIPLSFKLSDNAGNQYVKYIADAAFKNCSKLTTVNLNCSKLLEIGTSAFYGCSALASINLTDSLRKIGANAFMNCTSLESISLPDSVTSCGNQTFRGCTKLTSAYIGDGLTEIANSMFYGCEKLDFLLVSYSKIKSIYPYAFCGCSSLKSVVLPDTVTYIGAQAFANCTSLNRISMKKSLYDGNCDSTAFKGDRADLEIEFEKTGDIGCSKVNGRLWYYTISNNLAHLCQKDGASPCVDPKPTSGTLAIPASLGGFAVGGIKERAFWDCSGMTKVVIPSAVQTIEKQAFWNCSGLTELTLPSMLKTIGENAFTGCSKLTEVTIPDSVTTIGSYAFSGCSNLKKATLPKAQSSYNTSHVATTFYNCHDDLMIVYRWDDGAYREFVNSAAWVYKINGSTATVLSGSSIGSQTMPSKLGGCSVTAIADGAWLGKSALRSMTLPDTLKTIGANAFKDCTALESMALPDSVTSIGKGAFSGCTAMETCYLPSSGSVTKIPDNAFYKCTNLVSVAYTFNVKEVGSYAFQYCSSLVSFASANLETINAYAFAGCTALAEIYVPDTTTSIADYAFSGCSSLLAASLPGALAGSFDESHVFKNCASGFKITYRYAAGEYAETVDSNVWRYKYTNSGAQVMVLGGSVSGSVTIPSTLGGKPVTAIGDGAFSGNTDITALRINPNTVKTIGASAFANCSNLASVQLYTGITTIGANAFKGCAALKSISVPSSVTSLDFSAFTGCSSLTTLGLPEEFYKNHDLSLFDGFGESFTVTYGPYIKARKTNGYVWYMMGYTLYSASSAYTAIDPKPTGALTIPYSLCGVTVKTIGAYAFKDCSGMTAVTIPTTVTTIEEHAFDGCTGLTSIRVPNSVTSVGDYAFKGCTSLSSAQLPEALNGKINASVVFSGCSPTIQYYAAGGVLSETKNGYTWYYMINDGEAEICKNKDYEAAINPEPTGPLTIPDTLGGMPVTKIGPYAFYSCDDMTSVVVPQTVREIGYRAFYSCDAIQNVFYQGKPALQTIGDQAFDSCEALIDAPLPNGLVSIGSRAFYGCIIIESVTIPDSVRSIGEGAFLACPKIVDVSIPASVEEVGDQAFWGGIQQVTLNSQYVVDSYVRVFNYNSLKKVTITEGVKSIGESAFSKPGYLFALEEITLPQTLESIGDKAFNYDSNLKAVTIPRSVRSIGTKAFQRCTSLTSIVIPATVETFGEDAFYSCTALESVTFEEGTTAVGAKGMFGRCSKLTSIVIPEGVTSIAAATFTNCATLAEITIPRTVTSIGDTAFAECPSLATVYVASRDKSRVQGLLIASGLDAAFVNGLTFIEEAPDFWAIEFDANGGTASETLYQREPDAALGELPTATLEGYTLAGWYTEKEGGSKISSSTKATADITYYAHWNIKKYTVTVDAGTGSPVPVEVDHGTTIGDVVDTLSDPERDGYKFTGWVDGDGNPLDLTTPLTADTTIQALWAKNVHVNAYACLDGVVDPTPLWGDNSFEGAEMLLFPQKVDGYVFRGWSTAPDGEVLTTDYIIVTDGLTLYAQFTLDAWTVTFDANGGVCDTASVRVVKGNKLDSVLSSLPEATKTGCRFGGWWTTATGGEEVYADWTDIDSDVTFYAHWRNVAVVGSYEYEYEIADGVVVIHEKDGYIAVSPSPSGKFEIPAYLNGLPVGKIGHGAFGNLGITEVVIPEGVTEIGSEAFEWCSSLETVTIPSSVTKIGEDAFDMCTMLKTVNVARGDTDRVKSLLSGSGLSTLFVNGLTFVEAEAPKFTVTLDPNGGTVDPMALSVEEGAKVSTLLPTPTYSGHSFGGWFTLAEGGDQVTAETTVTADITYYAHWTALTAYTVTLDANGGSVTPDSILVYAGEKVGDLPTPGKEGYRFTGWKKDSTTVTADTVVNADMTIVAQWELIYTPAEFTLTFDANGGDCATTSITVTEGQKIGTKLPEATRTGYELAGWKTADDIWIDAETVVSSDIACTAQWNPNMYTVTYNANGGTVGGVATLASDVFYDSAYSLPAPDGRPGWTFAGWFTEQTGGTQVNDGDTVKIIVNTTFYAHWTETVLPEYTVTFDANGGECATTSIKVTEGQKVGAALPTATRTGYELLGWKVTDVFWVDENTVVTANIDSTAQWWPNLYTVTYDANGGTIGGSATFTAQFYYDANYSHPYVEGQSGWTFLGWFTDPTGGTQVFDGATVKILSDTTLYAHWEESGTPPPATWTDPDTGFAWDYKVTADGEGIEIYKEDGWYQETSKPAGVVTIPETIDGKPVTVIGDSAFAYCTEMTGVVIPDTVTEIGRWAFDRVALTSITLPAGLKIIGDYAFYGCEGLTSVVIPDGVTTIGEQAFCGCYGLKIVTIPGSVTSIGEGAFMACMGMTSLVIEDGVTTIEKDAFQGCWSLADVTIPASVTSIGEKAFDGAPITTVHVDPGTSTAVLDLLDDAGVNTTGIDVKEDAGEAISFTVTFNAMGGECAETERTVAAGETVGTLPSATLTGYDFLGWGTAVDGGVDVDETTIVAGNVTYYAQWSSAGGGGETTYGTDTVDGYTYSFKVVDGKATIVNEDPNLQYKNGDVAIYPLPVGELTIPATLGGYPVVGIGYCAFMDCDEMTEVTIPSGVTRIDEWAFAADALTRVTIPASVTSIGAYAFYKDPRMNPLRVVYVSSASEKDRVLDMFAASGSLVGNIAFIDTTGPHYTVTFESVSREYYAGEPIALFPELKRDGYTFNAWYDSYELRNRVTEDFVVTGAAAFYARWTVTEAVQTAEANGYVWAYKLDGKNAIIYNNGNAAVSPAPEGHVEVPAKLGSASVVGIGDYALYECDAMTSVKIPDSVKTVGKQAFAYCSAMECVDCGKNVASIGSAAFRDCAMLTAVQFRGSKKPAVDSLTDDLFDGGTPADCTVYVNKSAKDWPLTTWQGRPVKRGDYMVNVPTAYYEDDEAACCKSLTGAGTYSLGKKVTLKATENPGYVFAGWYDREGALVSRTASYSYTVTGESVTFYADFVTVKEDMDDLAIYLDEVSLMTDENGAFTDDIMDWIESHSEPKLAFKGLPAGLKFDAKTYKITGKATKPGIYTVTASLTNKSVKKALTATFTIYVMNFTDELLPLEDQYGEYVPGVAYVVPFPDAEGWAVSGLPSGMKWTAKAVTDKTLGAIDANSVYGAPSKPGYYTVYFTKTVDKVKHTATATFVVSAFPVLTVNRDGNGLGAVKGDGSYAANKKVSLKATPVTGSVFQGWYTDDGELISQAASYSTYIMPAEDTTIVARFITAAEDRDGIVFDFNDGEVTFDKDSGTTYSKTILCGVYLEWPLAVEALSLPTVKVSGLPSGLKFTAKDIYKKGSKDEVEIPANTIYGTPTAASKAGKPSVIKVTITTAGKTKVEYTFVTTVQAVADWAVGSFNGGGNSSTGFGKDSQLTLTVTAAGKISGKYIDADGLTWTLSAANFYDGVSDESDNSGCYTAMVTGKNGKSEFSDRLLIQSEELGGVAYLGEEVTLGMAYQNNWKKEPWNSVAKTFSGTFTKSVTDTEGNPIGNLTLKFATSGAVSVKGDFIVNGSAYSASGSTVLIPWTALDAEGFSAFVHVYFPPKTGKFPGFVQRVDVYWSKTTGFSLP